MANQHMIMDDNGVIWSSSSDDAFEEGSAIMKAVEDGKKKGYKDAIGDTWTGDLVFVQELGRTR